MKLRKRIHRKKRGKAQEIAEEVYAAAEKLSDEKTRDILDEKNLMMEQRDLARVDLRIMRHEHTLLENQIEGFKAQVAKLQERIDATTKKTYKKASAG